MREREGEGKKRKERQQGDNRTQWRQWYTRAKGGKAVMDKKKKRKKDRTQCRQWWVRSGLERAQTLHAYLNVWGERETESI
jgi:hypothetical protein